MKITYRKLLADHHRIGRLADAILAEAREPSPRPAALARLLDSLATLVIDHIRLESRVAEQCADVPMPRQWHEVWTDGSAAFGALCSDWQRFLAIWSEDAIESDIDAFHVAAETMLGRLNERVSAETAALHVSGLQFGVIDHPEAIDAGFRLTSLPH